MSKAQQMLYPLELEWTDRAPPFIMPNGTWRQNVLPCGDAHANSRGADTHSIIDGVGAETY